jgi:hypothetical protein
MGAQLAALVATAAGHWAGVSVGRASHGKIKNPVEIVPLAHSTDPPLFP